MIALLQPLYYTWHLFSQTVEHFNAVEITVYQVETAEIIQLWQG